MKQLTHGQIVEVLAASRAHQQTHSSKQLESAITKLERGLEGRKENARRHTVKRRHKGGDHDAIQTIGSDAVQAMVEHIDKEVLK